MLLANVVINAKLKLSQIVWSGPLPAISSSVQPVTAAEIIGQRHERDQLLHGGIGGGTLRIAIENTRRLHVASGQRRTQRVPV